MLLGPQAPRGRPVCRPRMGVGGRLLLGPQAPALRPLPSGPQTVSPQAAGPQAALSDKLDSPCEWMRARATVQYCKHAGV